jgi:hypothetical protein
MVVDASWGDTLLTAIRNGAAGAAGEIRVAAGAPVGVRAVYLLRYSAYAPPLAAGPVRDIPADNAAYARTALDLVPDLGDGFWEAELHRRLPPEAGPLVLVHGAAATLIAAPPPLAFLRQRFHHGRHFGAFRVASGADSALGIVLRAPLVPAVLVWRIARRCVARPGLRLSFLTCLPLLGAFATAWAIGEVVGALRIGQPHEATRESNPSRD